MDISKLKIELKYTEDEISKEVTSYIKGSPNYENLELSIKEMLKTEPENIFYYNLLLKVYTYTENKEKITETLQSVILKFSGISYSDYLLHIQKTINLAGGELVNSKLITNLTKGSEHIGFIEHQVIWENQAIELYITKIVSPSMIGNEAIFYENNKSNFHSINKNVPKVLDLFYSPNKWCFITLLKIPGVTPNICELNNEEFSNLIGICLSVGENSCNRNWFFEKNNYSEFEIGLSENYLVRSFAHIHKKNEFLKIINWVTKTVTQEEYDPEIVNSILNVNILLQKNQFYKKIKPEYHYSFVHGSFYHNNLIKTNNSFFLIDWAHLNIAPKGCDVALLLRRLPFKKSTELLNNNEKFKKYDEIDLILWAYASIVVSLMINITPIKTEDPNHLFIPACSYINNRIKLI